MQIIDYTDVSDLTCREVFLIENLKYNIPQGLNILVI